jgi:transcriptional regulator with XRE-family HTH domain
MRDEVELATFPWSSALVRELSEKEFRDAYMADQVRTSIAFQIRALREQSSRRWSQAELADRSGKKQSVISRLEDPDYGKLSLQTLLEIACAFDLPLLVQFVEWGDWLRRMADISPSNLQKRSFDPDQLAAPRTTARELAILELRASSATRASQPISEPRLNSPPMPASIPSPLTDNPLGQPFRRSSELSQRQFGT